MKLAVDEVWDSNMTEKRENINELSDNIGFNAA